MQIKRKINLISNNNFISQKTASILKEKLEYHNFIVTEKYTNEAELNIAVGGDGAFLRAIHRNGFPDIPFVGINTGHLGFFQEIRPENIDKFISQYILEDYHVEEMYLMETEVITSDYNFNLLSVNEIVIKAENSKVMHLDLFVDDNHLEKFSGDGLIVSTPSGSTAYSYSAGGAIVYPTLESLQITPIAPIISKAFRSLPNSIIVPGDLNIKILPDKRHSNNTLIVNDGNEIKYHNIDYFNIKMSDKKIKKLNFDKNMYWNNLKEKFL